MSLDENTDYNLLRERVELKYGSKIVYSRECGALSQAIADAIGAQVSETTLKRFWKLVNASIQPSKYTLNSLSQYVGYNDFEDFQANRDAILSSEADDEEWQSLRREATAVSKYSFENAKSRFFVGYENSLHRKCANDFMDGFLESGKRVGMLVGPKGWGKSSMIAHIADDYFYTDGAPCSNDVLCYFDLESITQTLKTRQVVDDFYISSMGIESDAWDFYSKFEGNPDKVRGRVFIIIDGLDFSKHVDLYVRLLQRYRNCSFMRIILTMRTVTWNRVRTKLPFDCLDMFYNVDLNPESSLYCNFPLLSVRERFLLLQSCGQFNALTYSLLYNSSTRDLFGVPLYLDIFIRMCHSGEFSEIALMDEVFTNVFGAFGTNNRMLRFMSYFLFATQYGVKPAWEVSMDNFDIANEYGDIFNKLVSMGFLSVRSLDSRYIQGTHEVRFAWEGLQDFLIANYWLKEDGLNLDLLNRIAVHYSNNEDMKRRMFCWIIKFAFRESNIEVLNSMFSQIDLSFEEHEDKVWLKYQFCDQLRFNTGILDKILQKDNELVFYVSNYTDLDYLDRFAGDILQKFVKREGCRDYHLHAYAIMMFHSFLHCNVQECKQIYSEMLKLSNDNMAPLDYMLLFSAQIMHEHVVNGSVSDNTLKYIFDYAFNYYSDVANYDVDRRSLVFLLFDVFQLTKHYSELDLLAEKIVVVGCDFHDCPRYMITRLLYCLALYKVGKKSKYDTVLKELRLDVLMRNLTPNMFLFSAYRVSLILNEIGLGDRSDVKVFINMLSDFFQYEGLEGRE